MTATTLVFGARGQGEVLPPTCAVPGDKENGIIAHGPLVKRDGLTLAYRPVLRLQSDGKFVVHNQMFPQFPDDLADTHFQDGDYCGRNLHRAYATFAQRCQRVADSCSELAGAAPE